MPQKSPFLTINGESIYFAFISIINTIYCVCALLLTNWAATVWF